MFLSLLSILGPQYLASLRIVVSKPPDWKNCKQLTECILLVVLSPFYVYFQHIRFSYLDLKLRLQPNNQSLILAKEELKRSLNNHIKLELGLETIYQLVGQLILLLLAYTKTPTQSGLKTIFNEHLDAWNIFLLILSIVLSFKSCITSHWRALTACREHFPANSKLVSALYCLFGCLTRVTAIIMFFVGPLGLFDILRHLQGEQYPWDTKILDLVNYDGTMVLGNNPSFEWISVDRWKKVGTLYQQYENGTIIRDNFGEPLLNPEHLGSPPDYTLYVGFSVKYYLLIFFCGLGLQILAIFAAKSMLSKPFWNEFNWLEKIIHCLENSNVPHNAKEWDDGKGDSKEHIRRMKSNWIELLCVIIINGFFNLLLLLSLAFLGK